MRVLWIGLVGGLVACSGGEEPVEDTDDPMAGACGDILSADMVISGRVEDRSGAAVAGASVWLEERNWSPGTIHGQTTADGSGVYSFDAIDLPIVEGCWGTAVQFYLAGEATGLAGDKPLNPQVINAWNDGTLDVDVSDFPLVLDPLR